MAQANSINLLRSTQSHRWEKIMQWALSTGRFLIILTQTIALAAFVYRFSLDRQIIDLADSIEQNQAIVSFYKDEEARYRNLHERLTVADTLMKNEDKKTGLLQKFVEIARGNVVFNAITLNDKTVLLEVSTTSTTALSKFLAGIKTLNEVKRVSIDRAENKATNGMVVVSVTVDLKNGKEVSLPNETQ
jgi:hypothetical protein